MAIMLLGLAIIPMVSMFDAGLRASVVGSNNDRGRAIASEELAEIQALPFSRPDTAAADSVVEIYPPSNGPAGAGDHPCTAPIPTGFDCRVETVYARSGGGGIVADGNVRTMVQATVTVSWDGGREYRTTTLVSKETE